MNAEELADRLAAVAVDLVLRVRDDAPEDTHRWLRAVLPDPEDWFRLCIVLAAAVPDNRSWQALTAWARLRQPRELQPCGTHAAASRHRYRGEPLCEACRDAERERDRERKRRGKAR